MSVLDFFLFDENIELPNFEHEKDPNQILWQTRDFSNLAYRIHCISNKSLYRYQHEYESDGTAKNSFKTINTTVKTETYNGNPLLEIEGEWKEITFSGEITIISLNKTGITHIYDVLFEKDSIKKLKFVSKF